MTSSDTRMCFKCGEEPTADPEHGILCAGCFAGIQASGPLGGRGQQATDQAD